MATFRFINKASGRMLREGQTTPTIDIRLGVEGLEPPAGFMLSFEDYVDLGPGYVFRPREFFEVDDGKVEVEYSRYGADNTEGGTTAVIRIECLKAETFLRLRSMVMQRLGCKTISWSPAVETPSLVVVIRGDIIRIRHWMMARVQQLRQRLSFKLW